MNDSGIAALVDIRKTTHFRTIEWSQSALLQSYVKEIRFVDLRTTMHVMPLPAIERTIGKVKRKLNLKFVLPGSNSFPE